MAVTSPCAFGSAKLDICAMCSPNATALETQWTLIVRLAVWNAVELPVAYQPLDVGATKSTRVSAPVASQLALPPRIVVPNGHCAKPPTLPSRKDTTVVDVLTVPTSAPLTQFNVASTWSSWLVLLKTRSSAELVP